MGKDRKVSSLTKAIELAMGDGRSVGAADDPAKERWPQLYEWLSTIYVGKDFMKAPATLTVQLQPGGVSVKLTDRDMQQSVNVSCPHIDQAFDAIELALNQTNIPITSWGKKEAMLRKRRIRN